MKTLTDTDYIHTLIAEGEHQQQDFKFEISDARKIAKTLSAFANTDGGRLLIGVKDNGRIAGVRSEEEKYMIIMQDNGSGCKEIHYGYGLKQMHERVAILNGTIHFYSEEGFRTVVEIPKIGGKKDDESDDCR